VTGTAVVGYSKIFVPKKAAPAAAPAIFPFYRSLFSVLCFFYSLTMHIRQLQPGEQHLAAALFDAYRVFYGQPSDRSLAERFLRERLAKNESVVFIALEERGGMEVPLGFTQLYPTYSSVRAVKNWILNDLYVEAAHRKKGIGEQLVRTALDFAGREGASFLQLETATDNTGALRLYESIGFARAEPEAGFILYRIAV
jgi:ribosomal protein S18 acetylase RimI-like enzyme